MQQLASIPLAFIFGDYVLVCDVWAFSIGSWLELSGDIVWAGGFACCVGFVCGVGRPHSYFCLDLCVYPVQMKGCEVEEVHLANGVANDRVIFVYSAWVYVMTCRVFKTGLVG